MVSIAPSPSVLAGSGTTRSASTRSRLPNPSQPVQAPYGELNEKCRGSSSSIAVPHLGQVAPTLSTTSSAPSRAIVISPPESLMPLSSDSVSRARFSASIFSRSTTTSMSWRWCRPSFGGSSSSTHLPSMRARR
jgi:hypothetical protein